MKSSSPSVEPMTMALSDEGVDSCSKDSERVRTMTSPEIDHTSHRSDSECPDEFVNTLLPVRKLRNGLLTSFTENLINRVRGGRATPQAHVWTLLTLKQDNGESEDEVLAFPRSLEARLRLRKNPEPPRVDFGALCDEETALQADIDRLQYKIMDCETPGLIQQALCAIVRYRARLDALEMFLRARLKATSALRVSR